MSSPVAPSREFTDILRAERREILNTLRKTRFTAMKPGYSHAQLIPFATYAPWLDDKDFMTVYEAAQMHTLVDVYRCYELYSLASQAARLPGELAEVGVWRGGTAALLGSAARGKALHLFDTFTGVAKADAQYDTVYKGGEHADTGLDIVQALFRKLGLSAELHVGMFPDDTLADLPPRLCMAHIDVDTYGSAKESFDAIWPRLSVGGVVVFDDYGFWGCEGVTQCVDTHCRRVPNSLFMHNINGHGILAKTAAD